MKWVKILVAEFSFGWAFVTSRTGGFIGRFLGFLLGPFVSYFLKGFGEGLDGHDTAKEFIYYSMRSRLLKKDKNNKDNKKNGKKDGSGGSKGEGTPPNGDSSGS